tara:strand:- start:3308 stop:3574 length:267 start_codon:yes stop_codon:yes gene_type:complete
MSMHPKGPLPRKQPQQAQVKVDLKEAQTIRCKSCDNYLWIQAFVLKKISALVSPSGQEGLVPVQVFSCGNCGQVAEGFLDENVLDEEK